MINDMSIETKLSEAKQIIASIDPDDVPFIAAALVVDNDGIWTDDAHFNRQKIIRVFRTASLARSLN